MPNREILYRIRGVLFEWIEFLRWLMKSNSMSDKWFDRTIDEFKSDDNNSSSLVGGFNHYRRHRFFTETIDKANRLRLIDTYFDGLHWVAQAEQLMTGKIHLLGRETKIPFSGGWHIDPLVGKPWPQCFHAHVNKKHHIKTWDIKHIWEINRHQYLIVLGKAFWLTHDERYAEKVTSVIDSWIDENPYNMGVNWTSSLELAVRTISWIWSYFLCRSSVHFTLEFQKKLFKSIVEQARYIENHLSFYSSPYNHLIGEAAALHVIGSLFPMFGRGRRWERLGWSIMVERVEAQFHEDGMSVEQATFYHHFTLGFYLQSIFLRKNNGKPIPEKAMARIEQALEMAMHLTKPDGTLPMIGDIDNARSLYFEPSHHWDFRSFLGLGAILFNRPDFKKQSAGVCEELLWLANPSDITAFEAMPSAPPTSRSLAFPQSGYAVSRSSWRSEADYLCFDCGEIAAGLAEKAIPSAAHGHADALSFELAAKGKSFIVDGGFYTYFGDLDWHRHFRQEEAHNTVQIGKHRQAAYCGRLTWQNVKRPRLVHWESTDDYDAVAGRVDYDDTVWHIRQVIALKNHFWFIRDLVHTPFQEESIQSFLHFDHDVDVKHDEGACQLVAAYGDTGLLVKHSKFAKIHMVKGGANPDSGWIASGYGIRHAALRISFRWKDTVKTLGSTYMLLIPYLLQEDTVDIETIPEDHNLHTVNLVFNNKDNQFSITGHENGLYLITINNRAIKIFFPEIKDFSIS